MLFPQTGGVTTAITSPEKNPSIFAPESIVIFGLPPEFKEIVSALIIFGINTKVKKINELEVYASFKEHGYSIFETDVLKEKYPEYIEDFISHLLDLQRKKSILLRLDIAEAVFQGSVSIHIKKGKGIYTTWRSRLVGTFNRIIGMNDMSNSLYHRLR
ncbi:hypothetical protein LCGC14_2660830, partial [marine sediment metagenome]